MIDCRPSRTRASMIIVSLLCVTPAFPLCNSAVLGFTTKNSPRYKSWACNLLATGKLEAGNQKQSPLCYGVGALSACRELIHAAIFKASSFGTCGMGAMGVSCSGQFLGSGL